MTAPSFTDPVAFSGLPSLVPARAVRVLFINDTARNGGPGRSLHSILKFLDPHVVHRAVVLPRDGAIAELLRRDGVADELLFERNLVENPIEPWARPMERGDFDASMPLKALRLAGNVVKATRAMARLSSLVRRGRFDLIYCNGTNADFAGGLLTRLTGVPAIWHVRYTSIPPAVEALHRGLSAGAGVRRIVCVSQSAAALFPHCADKVRVIHNALDVAAFDPAKVRGTLRAELGLAEDTVVFGSHGRVLRRKGYFEMVRAARLALDAMSLEEQARVAFVVVGDTPEDFRPDHVEECSRLAASLGLAGRFRMLGFRSDVRPLVADFDVAVVPSVYADPLPRAVIESMAMAKPVVAFAVGGVVEMLDGATGQLVPFESASVGHGDREAASSGAVARLAEAFVRYARDPALRARQGMAGRERVLRDFDARAHARRIQREIVAAAGLERARDGEPMTSQRDDRMRRVVGGIVDTSGRHPIVVMLLALGAMAGVWYFALQVLVNPHTDLRELLPRDSPGLMAFEHQLGRVGGGATLIVVAESPDKASNERFADDLSNRLDAMVTEQKALGKPALISYVERGTKDVHAFFEDNKWVYADQKDLESAYDTLDFQIAVRSGLVTDLGDDEEEPAASASASAGAAPAPAGAAPAPTPRNGKKPALGLDEYRDRWKAKAREHDDFPSGYFETASGTMVAVRIVSFTTGMGDAGGDTLLERVDRLVREMAPGKYQPEMRVGFAGDIANAAAEKESIVTEAAWASGMAFVAIVAGLVWFFRSAWSLIVIAFPALLGVGAAYAFAYFRFGYVNTTGMFLGAIILGNGVNYPIVLLSRYREFRARGQEPADARREAVQNALRAELVGACVASIAYGSLTVTDFRGFNQFGWIGFVGMLLVWLSMIPCVPALIVIIEWVQSKLPPALRDPPPRIRADGSRGPVMRAVAWATERAPRTFLAFAAAITILAVWKAPAFLRDPWEYDFDRLGSRGSKHGGAGEWSNKADQVFGGRMNVAGALTLADTPEQVPLLKAQIIKNDEADPQGRLIADVATVYDLLPGTAEEQKAKLEVLDRIRDRLTPAVVDSLPEDERARVEELKPPESLRVLEPTDLPPLLRRRFEENDGRVGTVFYVKYKNDVMLSDGHNLLRIAKATDNVRLPDGVVVQTASRATIFAEMLRSMEKDGSRASLVSLAAVALVVLVATRNLRGALAVLAALLIGVSWLVGGAAWFGEKLNYVNFVTLPITFGIGCEYPFNVYDRSRLLGGDVSAAVRRVGGAVALCSYTTIVGYGSLLFADFQALQSFGRLAVSGEIACLTGALLVLPALLHVLGRRRTYSRTEVVANPGPESASNPD